MRVLKPGFYLQQSRKSGGRYPPHLTYGLAGFWSDYVQMLSEPGSRLSRWTFDCLADNTQDDWPACVQAKDERWQSSSTTPPAALDPLPQISFWQEYLEQERF